jgi:hypothetical protein
MYLRHKRNYANSFSKFPSLPSHSPNSADSMEGMPSVEEDAATAGASFFFPPGKILLNKYRPKYPPMMAKDSCHSLGKIFLREQGRGIMIVEECELNRQIKSKLQAPE